MSRSDYPYPDLDPNALRHDLPRYTYNELGQPVMELLRTVDLPEPPPRSPGRHIRLLATLVCVTLLASTTITVAALILTSSSAAEDSDRETGSTEGDRPSALFHTMKGQTVNATSDAQTVYMNTTVNTMEPMDESSSIE